MKNHQDNYYFDKEANDFFDRNQYDFSKLPEKKQHLVDKFYSQLRNFKIDNILEIGCHIGDLLNYSVNLLNSEKGYGIEPSSKAVLEGKKRFPKCNLINSIACDDTAFSEIPKCDLAIVNDVFCWVSRETILKTIANIDLHIKDEGHLIIRDFYPNSNVRNKNKHIIDQDVYCHKIVGSHVDLFLKTGNYQLISSSVFTDSDFNLSKTKEFSLLENRWIDVLLQKKWD
jgi:cyclopropane fatty-acyl-phospholipid synthase-like methyltransferase